ncbi:beta-ketoacyl synthase N-terminal-like domain-containing protein [Actinacidiphila glaucinigra]|uniref:beta-ketoacyl synthase N-terminal-like domain-containing protein n=1 Tax=Actinacidiphila glaucinigra TaxID=235986 RepID=UPI00381323BE
MRGGYPGNVAGAAFARALGWQGARVAGVYAACASGAQALDTVRAHILAGLVDTALVVGADAAPKGFFAPVGGEEARRPGLVALPRAGATNPAHFGLYARRRMALHGDTPEDFARVKVKNAAAGAANPLARQTGRRSPPPRWRPPRSSPTRCDYWTSAPPPTGAPSSSCLRPAPRDAGPGADPRGLHRHPGLPAHGARPPGHRHRLHPRRRAP